MEPRILFISTYPELTLLARQFSRELDVPMHITEGGFMKDGHLYAKKMEHKFDVIISQGGTAAALYDLIQTTPVISIQITVGDILKALSEAICFRKPLALISYRSEELHELEELTKLLNNIEYKIFAYSDKDEFQQQINRAFNLVEHTLIGMGTCIEEIAHKKDLNYVLIKSNPQKIKQSILDAKNILELKNKEKLRAERLKNIIDYSQQGIIAISKSGTITAFNSCAEKVLAVTAEKVLNKTLSAPSLPESITHIYGTGDFEIDKLLKLSNTTVLINRIPINIGSEYEETLLFFQKASDIQQMEYNVRRQLHAKGLVAKHTFTNIIGSSYSIKDTIGKAIKFSRTAATILIAGETGTGKELFAQSIHNASPRKDGPFVAINCAALPETLLESELFGYEEGAFTGAKKGGKTGLFELAHNGTIFLDEIGEISPSLQSRLLRVLQEKELLKIGGDRVININARVITATNKNLYTMMTEGKFREDLYFRINVLKLKISPLRERKEDLPALIEHFIMLINSKYETSIQAISKRGIELLQDYSWPGNVRELEIFLEKLIILTDDNFISEQFIESNLAEHIENQPGITLLDNAQKSGLAKAATVGSNITLTVGSLKDMELQIIKTMLTKFDGNKTLLAQELGISRATIWNKLNELKYPLNQ